MRATWSKEWSRKPNTQSLHPPGLVELHAANQSGPKWFRLQSIPEEKKQGSEGWCTTTIETRKIIQEGDCLLELGFPMCVAVGDLDVIPRPRV